jgi:hypothetical protein
MTSQKYHLYRLILPQTSHWFHSILRFQKYQTSLMLPPVQKSQNFQRSQKILHLKYLKYQKNQTLPFHLNQKNHLFLR